MNNSLSPDLEPQTDSVEGQPDALTSKVPENENDNATSEDEGKNILPENDTSTPEPNADPENLQRRIEDHLLAHYVRRGNGFCHVDRPETRLSRDELRRAVRRVMAKDLAGLEAPQEVIQAAIVAVCDEDSPDLSRNLNVWSAGYICSPGDRRRIVQARDGTADINVWTEPDYRRLDVASDPGVFLRFFLWVVSGRAARKMLLQWLASSLQNEDDRPRWSVMLYSEQKGTGKSTFANICRALFGADNSMVVNGVGKLTQRFNAPLLLSKFVNCEEVDVPAGSRQANDLKALFTDDVIACERKGVEVGKTDLVSVFLFTSNHIPYFLRDLDRRLYVIDVSHDGHASGPKSAEFADLVQQVNEALKDPYQVAALYQFFMTLPISPAFNPMSLNTAKHATPIMERILGADEANQRQLVEYLSGLGAHAITMEALNQFGRRTLSLKGTALNTMMLQLGWSQQKIKWDGVNYARSIWVDNGYVADGGMLHGPDGESEPLGPYLNKIGLQ